MTVARATAALLGIWLALGGMVEVSAYHKRELAQQQRAQAVVEANAAKLMRFVDGCLRGELSPLDDLIYDCRDVRLMHLPASEVRQELRELGSRAANRRTNDEASLQEKTPNALGQGSAACGASG